MFNHSEKIIDIRIKMIDSKKDISDQNLEIFALCMYPGISKEEKNVLLTEMKKLENEFEIINKNCQKIADSCNLSIHHSNVTGVPSIAIFVKDNSGNVLKIIRLSNVFKVWQELEIYLTEYEKNYALQS